MKSKFRKVRLLDKNGNPGSYYWFNSEKLVGITTIMVPGKLAGPSGDLMAEQKAGIDMGSGGLLVVDDKAENIVEMLEE